MKIIYLYTFKKYIKNNEIKVKKSKQKIFENINKVKQNKYCKQDEKN